MTHIYKLIETLDTGAIRLRCPECGRQVVYRQNGRKVVEVAGDTITPHRYGVVDNAKVEER